MKKRVHNSDQEDASEDESFHSSDEEAHDSGDSDYEPGADSPSPKRQKENKTPASTKSKESKDKDASKPQEQVIQRLRRSLSTSISAQMVYKPSLKGGSSRIVVEIPNLTMVDLEGVLGSRLMAKATKGPKQIAVTTAGDDLRAMLGQTIRKGLRYGATLCVRDDAIKFVYSKETRMLKATGACVMIK